ncbi:MAG: penicillin-binding protein activator [Pseudomonadota bacterium]
MTRTALRARATRPLSRTATLLVVIAILGGCATPPPDPTTEPAPEPAVDPAELTDAERAAHLLERARAEPDPDAVRTAIDALLDLDPAPAEHLEQADRLWEALEPSARTRLADRVRGARLAAERDELQLARERLGPDDPGDVTRTPEVYRQGLALHARLLTHERAWQQALDARLRLDPLLILDPHAQTANQQALWGLLAALRPAERSQLARDVGQPAGRAWVELFLALRDAPGGDAARRAAHDWRERHPSHPAANLLPELLAAYPLEPRTAGNTVVLLPLTGALAEPGRAVLDGLLRAWYAGLGADGQLQVHDTRGDPDTATRLYRKAVADGADRIIGPLQRDAVARVADLETLAPTTLLNRAGVARGAPATTLALDPEEDARAVADRAARAGWTQALGIIPEGTFGDRVASAHREALQRLDLTPRESERVQPGAGDLNQQIGQALGLDRSRARIRALQQRTGLELQADPQIRADVDHLFVAAPAREMRQIVPHLHFHGASHLPIMATAHAYPGHPDAGRDRDLTGIVFPDAPALFRADAPFRQDPLPRFVALGSDALHLALLSDAASRSPHYQQAGEAGHWSLNPYTRDWIREPAWARFEDGEPRLLARDRSR